MQKAAEARFSPFRSNKRAHVSLISLENENVGFSCGAPKGNKAD